jgi:hypothetical protein
MLPANLICHPLVDIFNVTLMHLANHALDAEPTEIFSKSYKKSSLEGSGSLHQIHTLYIKIGSFCLLRH